MKRIYRTLLIFASAVILAACSAENFDYGMEDMPGINGGYYEPSSPGGPQEGNSFDEITENGFISTKEQNVSTFSIDADGASYAYMRRCLRNGYLPDKNSVRIEEYLNYFTFDYPDPQDDHSVAINAEVGTCPWNPQNKLMRLGIKGKSLKSTQLPDANYVFLIDVSGSMNSDDKLGLLKSGLKTMVGYLKPTDRVSVITYSGSVERILESTLASDAETIRAAVSKLVASGSTAGGEAMKMAYEEALANFIEGGNNRVIMGTDGDFNVGVTSTEQLVEMVQDYASKGIYLTVCGFGTGNLNDSMMEQISNHGNGTYEYIDSEDELTKVFVNERSKFYSVANDSKVQITFDSTKVEKYRLVGYENRMLSEEDFENDKKDAGEIGAGQTITALYEIVLAEDYAEGAYATFDFRYKKALGEESLPLSMEIMPSDAENETMSENFCFAAGVAAYGMVLRNSQYKGLSTYELAFDLVGSGLSYDPHGYRQQLFEMIAAAQGIAAGF